jgi:hypothetical protein
VCSPGQTKNRGPDLAHGSWFLREAVLPPVGYLEVGTDLPRSAAPSGATVRRLSSIVLFITHTSGNDNRRHGAGAGSLGGGARPCQTEREPSEIPLFQPPIEA